MQIYAIRMYNFLRFGEKNNSVVFDLSEDQKEKIKNGQTTIDEIYDSILSDPWPHINYVKENGSNPLLGIVGIIDGDSKRSNGTGKSTLLEGISYVHFGKIVRLSANSSKTGDPGDLVISRVNGLIPDYVKESYVEELFEINGRFFVVKRGRNVSKNKKSTTPILEFKEVKKEGFQLQQGHRTADTEMGIEEVNDISFDIFASSQMFGQNDSGKFLTGTDKVKKEMIISLLKQEDKVKKANKIIKEKFGALQKEVDVAKGNIEFFEKQILNSYEKNTNAKRIDISPDILTSFNLCIKEKILQKNTQIAELDQSLIKLTDSINSLGSASLKAKIDLNLKQINSLQISLKDLDGKKNEALSEMRLCFDKLISKKNGNVLNEKECVSKIEKFRLELQSLQAFISSFQLKEKEEFLSKCQKARDFLNISKPKMEEMQTEENNLNSSILLLGKEIKKINAEKEKLEKNLKNTSNSNGSFGCEECGSVVEASHFAEKIKQKTIILSEKEQEKLLLANKLATLHVSKKEIQDKLSVVEKKYLNNEIIVNQEINSYKHKIDLSKIISESSKEAEHNLANLKKEFVELTSEIEAVSAKGKEIKNKFEKDILSNKENLLLLEKENESNVREHSLIEDQKKALDLQISKINTDKSNFSQGIGSLTKELELFKEHFLKYDQFNILIKEKADLLTKYATLQLVFGLDGVQTRVVKRYLPLLNNYVQEYLSILSNNEIQVLFKIDEKSEVVMEVKGGTSDQYGMLSGGEKMIIRLAVDIGLSLLSFARNSQKPEMIFLDEIFGPLDDFRTDSVFKMLLKLQDVFKKIILITHNSDIKNMIENNIIVEKSSGTHGISEIKTIV